MKNTIQNVCSHFKSPPHTRTPKDLTIKMDTIDAFLARFFILHFSAFNLQSSICRFVAYVYKVEEKIRATS